MSVDCRWQLDATYYVGKFREEFPDGVVRVEKPGATPILREFRASKDVGKGNSRQLQKLSFRSDSSPARTLNP